MTQLSNPDAPDYDWQRDREWFNQRLANAHIHNSELEKKLEQARKLLIDRRCGLNNPRYSKWREECDVWLAKR